MSYSAENEKFKQNLIWNGCFHLEKKINLKQLVTPLYTESMISKFTEKKNSVKKRLHWLYKYVYLEEPSQTEMKFPVGTGYNFH